VSSELAKSAYGATPAVWWTQADGGRRATGAAGAGAVGRGVPSAGPADSSVRRIFRTGPASATGMPPQPLQGPSPLLSLDDLASEPETPPETRLKPAIHGSADTLLPSCCCEFRRFTQVDIDAVKRLKRSSADSAGSATK